MRQKFGQNFLIDNNIANNIIKMAKLEKDDNVIEIGPGKGILTKIIQPQIKHLTAVEIDRDLTEQLNRFFLFHRSENIEIINKDFLKFDFDRDCTIQTSKQFKIISNLPYNVGTAIIQKILPLSNWSTAVFMLQKEVGGRLAAKPKTKDYGYISILTSYYADCQILFDVSPRCFNPQPKVASTVIKLINRFSSAPNKLFFNLVKYAFSMRRKTILNSLSSFMKLDKSTVGKIIEHCGLDVFLRPDKLSLEDFLKLTDKLCEYLPS
ncbi:MAG: 16S rRNA (adenine(1518)-N(6)/adenine(1519)-N(6))-dimethyltransferase RsmA [Endomicrobium sp.]|jgi:16S rRNA (adenine1518-N6/adenine1519-N6)-dimethyltransferase|nr:16S rRNA (adenine(1518)-N(6)/adenine(1519)-N(6))-dimethyltransferase RsmA [Endomicrobium sp.]